MKNFIDSYIYLLAIGLFIVFALIGYLVETIKKDKENNKENIINEVAEENYLEIEKDQTKENPEKDETQEENIMVDQGDDLLDEYNNNIQ